MTIMKIFSVHSTLRNYSVFFFLETPLLDAIVYQNEVLVLLSLS